MQEIIEKINKLKKERKAIILAHCYQNVEIDNVADYVGDSLGLSRIAAKTDAEIIVFAGVYFMAETAKILSPDKKVLLPNMNSGCQMANMIDIKRMIKAQADVCCTSSNAIDIVRSLNCKKVLFAPDCYLGSWVAKKLPDVEIISYNGFCPTHLRLMPDEVKKMRILYPDAATLVHPECHQEVVKLADFVGSTTQIMQYCERSKKKTFLIGTEKGVVDRLSRDFPEKEFILISDRLVCHNMKYNTLEDILHVLQTGENEVFVEENLRKLALGAIERMVKCAV